MSQQNPSKPTHLNRTSLYNPQISPPILNANENTPSLNPSNTSEIKLTPMGHSPEKVEAYHVKSTNQELVGNSSLETQRAY